MYHRKFIFVLALGFSTLTLAANELNQITGEGKQRIQEGKAAQIKIDQLSEAASDLVSKFKTVSKTVDGLKIYNDLLQIQVDNQKKSLDATQDSINNVGSIERQVVPLMVRMIDSLEQFIQLDVPFLMDERTGRIEKLRNMMQRSDVSSAEKFRRVIEAYQIENDYGRTIEAYRGNLSTGGRSREVDFLRVGRVALLYQSVGRDATGAWNSATEEWQELPAAEYKNHVTQGLRIARKQVAPDLLVLPIAAAKEIGQ